MRNTRMLDQQFQHQDSAISLGRVVLYGVFAVIFIYLAIGATNYVMRGRMVERVVASVNDENIVVLSQLINWPELRENVKERINRKIDTAASLGRSRYNATKLSPEQVNHIVDYYVQPGGLEILMRLKNAYAPDYHPRRFVKKTGFNGLAGFNVIFTHPEPTGGNSFIRSQEVILYLELRGLEWKIVDVDIPLIFVPSYVPKN